MTGTEILGISLVIVSVCSAVSLIHLQNQVNRLRRSQRALSEGVSIGISSMIEYIDAIQRGKE